MEIWYLFGSEDDSNMIISVFNKCGLFLAENLKLFRVLIFFSNLFISMFFFVNYFLSLDYFFGPNSVSKADYDNQNINSNTYY